MKRHYDEIDQISTKKIRISPTIDRKERGILSVINNEMDCVNNTAFNKPSTTRFRDSCKITLENESECLTFQISLNSTFEDLERKIFGLLGLLSSSLSSFIFLLPYYPKLHNNSHKSHVGNLNYNISISSMGAMNPSIYVKNWISNKNKIFNVIQKDSILNIQNLMNIRIHFNFPPYVEDAYAYRQSMQIQTHHSFDISYPLLSHFLIHSGSDIILFIEKTFHTTYRSFACMNTETTIGAPRPCTTVTECLLFLEKALLIHCTLYDEESFTKNDRNFHIDDSFPKIHLAIELLPPASIVEITINPILSMQARRRDGTELWAFTPNENTLSSLTYGRVQHPTQSMHALLHELDRCIDIYTLLQCMDLML